MTGPKRQAGQRNNAYHVVNAPPAHERVLDHLRCDQGVEHDVRMEWATRGGMRTGALIAYCGTCRRVVVPSTAIYRTHAEMRAKRQEARLTQAVQRKDAQARREYIKRAVAQGDRQKDIAERLGMTPQRLSQIINGRAKKGAA